MPSIHSLWKSCHDNVITKVYITLNTANNNMIIQWMPTEPTTSHASWSRNLNHGLTHSCVPYTIFPAHQECPELSLSLTPRGCLGSHLLRYHTVFLSTVDWTKGGYFSQTEPVRFLSLRFLNWKWKYYVTSLGDWRGNLAQTVETHVEKHSQLTKKE